MRLTKKYILNWVNEKFKSLEINGYKAGDMYHTRFRGQDYEAGATTHIIRVYDENGDYAFNINFLWGIKEVEYYLNNGHELNIDFNTISGSIFLADSEITYRKI